MLPTPSRQELKIRVPRLMFGLVLFGLGLAMMVVADLGLAPWEVLHQGITRQSGIPIGTVGIITGLIVLILWFPLGERVGIGTICNVFTIGIVIDLTLWVSPDSVDSLLYRWVLLLGGVLLIGIGSGYYIGSGLGSGPRDGLMTGLERHGINIAVARTAIEATALVGGWLLGGTVGLGTVIFTFGIGPLVAIFLPRLAVEGYNLTTQSSQTR